ncbi:hypothetical protein L207DRAFT_47249 [Hyaloscypha variabilis F]|uniref:BZIP transcription factor n=1 Tax=Hyaloscypha variabilis (strain UAMH 11265 / GT02V1 / F) TaxID=1149755 RepID=A0A2J6RKA0_HYAVF|nr:hypothetical protein L207DRAFT_47249 [Hyaloscypha variabilis F]
MAPGEEGQQKRDFSEEATSPGDPANDQNKKRRTTGSSSRGVANLTPDQLAKKRANDREAQRAIRERTKNQIESLERRIRDLTSQQPYQELQHVLRQKEAVEAENADIKKRLASVLALIQPILAHHGLEIPQYSSPVQPYGHIRPGSSSNHNTSTPNSAASPAPAPQWQAPSAPMGHDPRAHLHTQNAQTLPLIKQKHEMTHNLDMGPERLGLDFLLHGTQRINKVPNGVNGTPEPTYQHVFRGSDRGSPAHHRSNSMGSHSNYNPPTANAEIPGHAVPIKNGPPTCPLDSLLLEFLHERQQQASEGVSTPKLVGPAYPSVSSLLNPARSLDAHPLSKVFTDILATFPDLSTLPEKVAVLYIMFLIMRWQIAPTQENYDRLPEWVAPRPSQLFTLHPAWIDHLPWPKMRDRLVRDYNPRDYLFDNFFIPFTTTLSVNWSGADVLMSIPDSDELIIDPVFERHLRQLENWSLGPTFAKAFPGLQDTYRLKTEGDRR